MAQLSMFKKNFPSVQRGASERFYFTPGANA